MTITNPAPLPADFDPSDYPRTYRASPGWLTYCLLLSGLVGVSCLAAAWYFGTGHEMHGTGQAAAFATGSLLLALFCAFDIADTLMLTVTLDASAIKVRRVWGERRLRRDEISGYPAVRSPRHPGLAPNTLVLFPRERGQRSLKIPLVMPTDPPFLRWMATLPDFAVMAGAGFERRST